MLCYLLLLESDRDREAFAQIYHAQKGKLLAVARGFFRDDPTHAEDAVHSAFVSIANNFQKIFQLPCHERDPYLVTIVKNACRDILRREKKYAEWVDRSDADRGLSPDTAGLDESYRRAVEIICALPDAHREILERRLIEGLSNREAAKKLGISESTAAQRYKRAREVVARQLTKEGLGID
ncbi:MAG: sigma-70 family RNA polymerase sigma factor [Clostridia bacterium]|nr:sigma-70 family RNA polymerase sigma factor [Clostridia bacterium]